MTHPSPKRNMVPKVVLMRSCLVSLTTARPINTAQPRTTVNTAWPMTNVFNKEYPTVRRPINNKTSTKNSNFNQKVNIAKPKAVVNAARPKAVLNAVKGNNVNVVKASACWIQVSDGLGPQKELIFLPYVHGNPHQDLKEKGVIDSGCSRHMTGNMYYLTDFEEIDGGYVAFRDNPKGGKITSKGKARMETVSGKDYILLPLWTADPPFSQSIKSSPDVGFKPLGDDEKKKEDSDNITNNVNVASTNEVNAIGIKTSIELPDDPNMPELEDIVYSDDDED
ncbi:hypothetical protein Tco_0050035, partial [Tanacetum coccineum]